ncbi:hypothetical protein VKT23_009270 [Stygiomarasmius scandens]|uniref:Peptidase C14 caspase domain-containing protein n=1 Tax=Marasmiellus scandens TaxID=2682957 RepID=A0ABR1JHB5_9AGAR
MEYLQSRFISLSIFNEWNLQAASVPFRVQFENSQKCHPRIHLLAYEPRSPGFWIHNNVVCQLLGSSSHPFDAPVLVLVPMPKIKISSLGLSMAKWKPRLKLPAFFTGFRKKKAKTSAAGSKTDNSTDQAANTVLAPPFNQLPEADASPVIVDEPIEPDLSTSSGQAMNVDEDTSKPANITDSVTDVDMEYAPQQSSLISLDSSESNLPISSLSLPLFALIIGVDNYADSNIPKLAGCVADANDISMFLTRDLGVQADQIINLRNEQATRTAIINNIETLGLDSRISRDDPILVYYAGHGSNIAAPREWIPGVSEENAKIQMLLPHDFVPTSKNGEGQGILDVQLSTLLTRLADIKGNNITVIFDSCCSGSGTRTNELISVRSIELPKDYQVPSFDKVLHSLDNVLSSSTHSRAPIVAKGHENDGLASHVLLAACSRDEVAYEEDGRGRFTRELTKFLRDRQNPTHAITYEDVVKRLPDLPMQKPQCEGKYSKRILFNGKVPNHNHMQMYEIHPTQDKGKFTIEAGHVQGVTDGTRFAIYSEQDRSSPSIGELVSVRSNVYSSILEQINDTQNIPSPAWALQTQVGDIVLVNVALALPDLYDSIIKKVESLRRIAPILIKRHVEDEEHDYVFAVTKDTEKATFYLTDEICRKNKLTRLPHSEPLDVDRIHFIIIHAGEFFWALQHPSESNPQLLNDITLESYELIREGYRLKPTGSDLNIGGQITVLAGDDIRYGFKVTSKHSRPLYAWLFSFNMSDLSIDIVYKPNLSKSPDSCLGALNGELEIGYGAGGSQPQSFYLPSGMDADVTYLKLFLTTEHVDLSRLERPSPFGVPETSGRASRPNPVPSQVWGTILVPIIQKRP